MAELEHIPLHGGAWAKFRDPDDITEEQRRPAERLRERMGLDGVLQAVYASRAKANKEDDAPVVDGPSQADLSDAQLDIVKDYAEACVIALVEEWSFGEPMTIAGLRAIKGRNYRTLVLTAGERKDKLFFDADVDLDDPESPTSASNGSSRPSEATPTAVLSLAAGGDTSS